MTVPDGYRFPSRAFNTVVYDAARNSVRKSGTDTGKINAEACWFADANNNLVGQVAPILLTWGSGRYETRYLPFPTVAELAADRMLDAARLLTALDRCWAMMDGPPLVERPEMACRAAEEMYIRQPARRLAGAGTDDLWKIDSVNGEAVPTLYELLGHHRVASLVASAPSRFGRIHGDFHFGNMLFDQDQGNLWLVDPRGSFGHLPAWHGGDRAYDLAKLSHSMIGGYDHLAADRFTVAVDGHTASLSVDPVTYRFDGWLADHGGPLGVTFTDIRLLEAVCFVSLAALHTENPERQTAMVVRGLQIAGEVLAWAP